MGCSFSLKLFMKIPKIFRLFERTGNNSGRFAVCLNKRGVYLAHVNHIGGRPHVVDCAFHPEQDVTSSVLEKICKKARFSGHQLTTLLAPGEYQLLLVDAPNVPAGELKTAIRWRIKDMLNYHIDDATVDVLQIPVAKYGAGRLQSIYAVAASNVTIQKRIALFEKAGLALNVIDIPEMAQRNIAALFEENAHALVLIVFNGEGGLLTVTAGGELYMSRRIEITAGQLQDANEALRSQHFDRVALEVQRSLDYFGRQYHYIPVRRVLIAAPESAGLETFLAGSVELPVERMNLAQVMDIGAVPELAQGDYAVEALHALGAALRQERRAL